MGIRTMRGGATQDTAAAAAALTKHWGMFCGAPCSSGLTVI